MEKDSQDRFLRRHRVLAGGVIVAFVGAGVWGMLLWQLRGNVDRYRRYWAQPHGEPGGLLYVALGDSTAQGVGASRPELGYVGLVAARLSAATGRPVEILNLSRSGAHLRDVVAEQIPQFAGRVPDLVTVGVGANDMGSYDPLRFQADVDLLMAALPPRSVVGDVPWFMHGGTGRNSDDAATQLSRAARERGLPVAGLHEAMHRRGWRSMATDFAVDWFHPNDRGHRLWAETYWTAIAGEPGLLGP